MNLRPYQSNGISQLYAIWGTHRRVTICSPTGTGKTVFFAALVKKLLSGNPNRIIHILAHRRELVEQASEITNNHPNVQIFGVEAYNNRIKAGKMQAPNVLIIDEAHIGNFTKIYEHYRGTNLGIVQMTATPLLRDKKDKLSNYSDKFLELISLTNAIEQGYLSNCKTIAPEYIDLKKMRVKNGEYDEEIQTSLLIGIQAKIIHKILPILKICKGMVFCASIKHSEAFFNAIKGQVRYCWLVHSQMPTAERDKAVSEFLAAEYGIIINCGILTTGFNCPDVTDIFVLRKTKSLPLWMQICGRGSRVTPNKRTFTVWDFGLNWQEHGTWDTDHDWQGYWQDGHNYKPRAAQAAGKKNCQNCDALIAAQAKVCKYCGFEQKSKKKPENTTEINELREVTKDVPEGIVKIREMQVEKKYKPAWAFYKIKEYAQKMGENVDLMINKFTKLAGYKAGWHKYIKR